MPVFFLAFKVPKYTATVDIELTLDQTGLKKKWLKQFIFSNKPDLDIKWTEIQDYVFEPDRQFDKFKMTLKDGSKFKFFHNNDYNDKDDFLTFLRHFEQKINQINNDKDISNDIKRGKAIYETNWGLALAAFAILIIIAVPLCLFSSRQKRLQIMEPLELHISVQFIFFSKYIFTDDETLRTNKATANTG